MSIKQPHELDASHRFAYEMGKREGYAEREAEVARLRAERDHYRDHSPAGRVSFKACEADECIDASPPSTLRRRSD